MGKYEKRDVILIRVLLTLGLFFAVLQVTSGRIQGIMHSLS